MKQEELFEFLNTHRWAVAATRSPEGYPQAAVVGYVAFEQLDLLFDTFRSSRKMQNLSSNSNIAIVIGWDEGCTLQYEGTAAEFSGPELEPFLARYFDVFPDGRDRAKSPDLAYVRVSPVWLRFSDFRVQPPNIVEMTAESWKSASK